MAKFDKDYKPTGDEAKAAELPKGFQIAGAIRVADVAHPLTKGMEEAYAATKPNVADVKRLVDAGVLVVLDDNRKPQPFEVKAASAKAATKPKAGDGKGDAPKTGDDAKTGDASKTGE